MNDAEVLSAELGKGRRAFELYQSCMAVYLGRGFTVSEFHVFYANLIRSVR